jgi:hypothetical protein
MSSTASFSRRQRILRYLGVSGFGDVFVASIPLIAVAFIIYIILQGTFW